MSIPDELLKMINQTVGNPDFDDLSDEERNAALNEVMMAYNARLDGRRKNNRLTAEECLNRARTVKTKDEALAYTRKALEIDPEYYPAEAQLAILEARSAEEMIEGVRKALDHGKEVLKKQGISEEDVGYYWGIVETRPYMRVMNDLMGMYISYTKYEEAVKVGREMLRLNPGDNQGIRWQLIYLYAYLKDGEGVAELRKMFPDEGSSYMVLGRCLYHYRTGDVQMARESLIELKKRNKDLKRFLDAIGNPAKIRALAREASPYGVRLGTVDELLEAYEYYGSLVFKDTPQFAGWASRTLKELG